MIGASRTDERGQRKSLLIRRMSYMLREESEFEDKERDWFEIQLDRH